MASHGHLPLLRTELQAPIIVAFRAPPGVAFPQLYERVRAQGYIVARSADSAASCAEMGVE